MLITEVEGLGLVLELDSVRFDSAFVRRRQAYETFFVAMNAGCWLY